MVRSLWTAASGMLAQQNNVDTIANNLANVNTTGYKTESVEFKSLLYQDTQSKTTSANGALKPVSAQIGLGVRNASITSNFRAGSFFESKSSTAFAIEGDGFFGIQGQDGNKYYTKNGDFKVVIGGEDKLMLTTSSGEAVLDTQGKPITFDGDIIASKLTISATGEFLYPNENNNPTPLGVSMGLYQFSNPAGLEKEGNSLFSETAASGPALNEATNTEVKRSSLAQGYLEGSNVQVVDEMVNMIVAQRAYEMNSKTIQASDDMMQQANSLRR